MKGVVATICASILILSVSSPRPTYALTPQQELMKTCNSQAGNQKLTGDARKSFMSDCLSGKASTTFFPQLDSLPTASGSILVPCSGVAVGHLIAAVSGRS